jgi:hypothetical protein
MNLSFADTSVAMVQGFFGPAPEKGDQTLEYSKSSGTK